MRKNQSFLELQVRLNISRKIEEMIRLDAERVGRLKERVSQLTDEGWVKQCLERDVEDAETCILVAEQVINEITGNPKGGWG